jgi:hypothetical protein
MAVDKEMVSSLETIHYYATKAYRTLKIDSRDNLKRNPAPLPLLPNKNTGGESKVRRNFNFNWAFQNVFYRRSRDALTSRHFSFGIVPFPNGLTKTI